MLPGSSPERVDREAAKGKQSGRTVEIQRLIGRSLRAACDMTALGERQVVVDCDVLQADGGTRTASICGGFLALHDALARRGRAPGGSPAQPAALVLRGDQRRDRRRRARARPALRRGQHGRGRHERRHAAPGRPAATPASSRSRARPRAWRSRAASSTSCSALAEVGLAEIADLQAEMVAVPPAATADEPCRRSSARRPTRTRSPRSSAILGDVVELLPRPADVPDVVEDADTLEGNARLKAAAIAAATGRPAVADDTGLEVAALGGAPGVRTARVRRRGRHVRRQPGQAARRARRRRPTGGRGSAPWPWSCGPTASELAVEGVCDGTIAPSRARRAGLRLRRRVRARRRRRPHVRRDDRGREARAVAPRPGVQGAAGTQLAAR